MSNKVYTYRGRRPIRTVTISFFRFPRIADRIWVLGQMGAARLPLTRTPGLGFFKLFGSGSREGFTLSPNTEVWAILGAWSSPSAADEGLRAPVFEKWRRRAGECWTVFLDTASARGEWSGAAPFTPSGVPPEGPLAVITRATIKPSRALKFWRRAPAISDVIGADPNVAFKIGLGEAPGLQQVTFSIWPDAASMTAFARGDGPHARAIKAVREGGWFREELYARFRIAGEEGAWGGASPLAGLDLKAAA